MSAQNSKIKKLAGYIKKNPEDSFSKFALALEFLKEDQINKARILFEDIEKNDPCYVYYGESLNPGTIHITHLDTSLSIISGTFSVTLKNPECMDSVMTITDGRFDFNY